MLLGKKKGALRNEESLSIYADLRDYGCGVGAGCGLSFRFNFGGPVYASPRKYLSARSTVLFARKHATRAQQAKLWASILVTLPFVFLRRLATGEQRGVWLKIRGWLDGLRDRDPPFQALGLR